LVGAGVSWEA
jgi:hypothetical protein